MKVIYKFFFQIWEEGLIIFNKCMLCMLSCFSHVQLFVTLWTVSHQVPLCVGFSRQEYQSGQSCPPPGDPPGPGMETVVSEVSCIGRQVLCHQCHLRTPWTAARQAPPSMDVLNDKYISIYITTVSRPIISPKSKVVHSLTPSNIQLLFPFLNYHNSMKKIKQGILQSYQKCHMCDSKINPFRYSFKFWQPLISFKFLV